IFACLLAVGSFGAPDPPPRGCDLGQATARAHAQRGGLEDIAFCFRTCVIIAFLEQQPLWLPRAVLTGPICANQHPAAAKLLAVQSEFQPPLLVTFVRVSSRFPPPAVPQHHRAATIFAFGV